MTAHVFFVTNRNRLPDQEGIARFGDEIAHDPRGLAFGIATLQDIDPADAHAGRIVEARVIARGSPGPDLARRIMAEGAERPLLVFVPGAADGFGDSLRRCARKAGAINAIMGGAGGVTPIVFSWPARTADGADDDEAAGSAGDFAAFLDILQALKPRLGGRRLCLLVQNTASRMLGFGLAHWFAMPRGEGKLFDQVILPAAEDDPGAFGEPGRRRLADLPRLASRISFSQAAERGARGVFETMRAEIAALVMGHPAGQTAPDVASGGG